MTTSGAGDAPPVQQQQLVACPYHQLVISWPLKTNPLRQPRTTPASITMRQTSGDSVQPGWMPARSCMTPTCLRLS